MDVVSHSSLEHLFFRVPPPTLSIAEKQASSESPIEEKPSSETSYVVGTWPNNTAGHTGYLTVATLPPFNAGRKSKKVEENSSADNGTSEPIET